MSIKERVKVVEVVAIKPEPPLIVNVDTTVRAVIEQMRKTDTGCALLTRDERLVGIFTERDVLTRVVGNTAVLDGPVAAVMTADPTTMTDSESIRKAVAEMRTGGFRHIPIIDDSARVVGCVRHEDIIAYLVETFADHALNLPPDPDQIAKTPEGA